MNNLIARQGGAEYTVPYANSMGSGLCVQTKRQARVKEDNKLDVIHTVPKMTDGERKAAKKRIGGELYEVFARIQEKLNLESENQ